MIIGRKLLNVIGAVMLGAAALTAVPTESKAIDSDWCFDFALASGNAWLTAGFSVDRAYAAASAIYLSCVSYK